jgi:hypothetical protein
VHHRPHDSTSTLATEAAPGRAIPPAQRLPAARDHEVPRLPEAVLEQAVAADGTGRTIIGASAPRSTGGGA